MSPQLSLVTPIRDRPEFVHPVAAGSGSDMTAMKSKQVTGSTNFEALMLATFAALPDHAKLP